MHNLGVANTETPKYLNDVVLVDVLFIISIISHKILAKSANILLQRSVSMLLNTCLPQMSTSNTVVRCLILYHPLKKEVLYTSIT